MKLYYAPGTCALTVHTALIWADADYELEKVELGSEAFKKINPMGSVPAMVDGDSGVMTQMPSLISYISGKYPDKNICGAPGLKNQQVFNQWISFLCSDLHPAFGPVFNTQSYTTKSDEESLDCTRKAASKRLGTILNVLEQHLAGKNHIVGSQKTAADAHAYIISSWLGYADINIDNYPHIKRLYETMKQDPGIARAETEQGMRK
ncbi:MAG: glutathione S-transferase family protein [Desulfobacterales bacterium]|nr:glutathione S-transferase family protein [Desulfobacterales bacterium]